MGLLFILTATKTLPETLKFFYMKLVFAFLTLISINSYAQTENEDVKKPILALFNGMRQSDTALMRSAFAPNAILQTIGKNKEGVVKVKSEVISEFISFIAKPRKELLDERISFETIKVDGDLAMVWTPYQFYVSETFSHCGVNSFQLVKLDGEWKIQYIIDTRRKDNCK